MPVPKRTGTVFPSRPTSIVSDGHDACCVPLYANPQKYGGWEGHENHGNKKYYLFKHNHHPGVFTDAASLRAFTSQFLEEPVVETFFDARAVSNGVFTWCYKEHRHDTTDVRRQSIMARPIRLIGDLIFYESTGTHPSFKLAHNNPRLGARVYRRASNGPPKPILAAPAVDNGSIAIANAINDNGKRMSAQAGESSDPKRARAGVIVVVRAPKKALHNPAPVVAATASPVVDDAATTPTTPVAIAEIQTQLAPPPQDGARPGPPEGAPNGPPPPLLPPIGGMTVDRFTRRSMLPVLGSNDDFSGPRVWRTRPGESTSSAPAPPPKALLTSATVAAPPSDPVAPPAPVAAPAADPSAAPVLPSVNVVPAAPGPAPVFPDGFFALSNGRVFHDASQAETALANNLELQMVLVPTLHDVRLWLESLRSRNKSRNKSTVTVDRSLGHHTQTLTSTSTMSAHFNKSGLTDAQDMVVKQEAINQRDALFAPHVQRWLDCYQNPPPSPPPLRKSQRVRVAAQKLRAEVAMQTRRAASKPSRPVKSVSSRPLKSVVVGRGKENRAPRRST
ncbi:hypothetical protein C8R46DRAFT_1038620 [Mycena filopes]|nr:hypothetical protein C8R46DRAFT_1038620 [Mycena filopes]